jgi:spore maturation protein B
MIYILPVFVLIIIIIGFIKGVPCFDSFVSGAKDGIDTVVRLLPYFVGLIVAIGVFKSSGILDVIGVKNSVLPLMIIRPISGSASLATLKDILTSSGPDSIVARTACVMMGSTETIFYTMAIYTKKTNLKKLPGVLPAALAANVISAIASTLICSVI